MQNIIYLFIIYYLFIYKYSATQTALKCGIVIQLLFFTNNLQSKPLRNTEQ
jgi:hypothetical protein